MPRAHRVHLPGQIWHLTHRCHHRRFLLKFARDRRLWRSWLYKSRRRFGLCVLDSVATSKHIHLIARDRDEGEIAAILQLIEGCTGQAYNRRKRRGGDLRSAVRLRRRVRTCVSGTSANPLRCRAQHPGGAKREPPLPQREAGWMACSRSTSGCWLTPMNPCRGFARSKIKVMATVISRGSTAVLNAVRLP